MEITTVTTLADVVTGTISPYPIVVKVTYGRKPKS